MKSPNQFITSKVQQSIEGVLWRDAFHRALENTQEATCPHRNPEQTMGESSAASQKLPPVPPSPKMIKGEKKIVRTCDCSS